VLHTLKASGLPPEALELELTESSFVDATDESLQALRELRSLGVSLALDDFGTGYSSLSYLRSLPVDCLKVDRSFVSDLPDQGDAERMLQAILGIATALRLRTVAEGIETPAQLEALRQHGCVEGQGFLLARPLAAPDCEALLADDAAFASGSAAPEVRTAGASGRAA
jgi:EAL domain-containing protein (putative c-di-GMP-specific phosphodiesterase class I)